MKENLAEADRAMLRGMLAASEQAGVEPCLIGAMALTWLLTDAGMRPLARATLDWDFAVAVASWRAFDELTESLQRVGGFRRSPEPHRFVHAAGGIIDMVPFGGLEDPPGSLRWPGGSVMSTTGFTVLLRDRVVHDLGAGLRVVSPSLPTIVGLKILAYADRRPGEVRDIRDVHHVANEHSWDDGSGLDASAEDAVVTEKVAVRDLGAFVLGRSVQAAFDMEARALMAALLGDAGDPWSDLVTHVTREHRAVAEERDRLPVSDCLLALRLGLTS